MEDSHEGTWHEWGDIIWAGGLTATPSDRHLSSFELVAGFVLGVSATSFPVVLRISMRSIDCGGAGHCRTDPCDLPSRPLAKAAMGIHP